MAFTLTSPAFSADEALPPRFTCDGRNVSPPLAWTGTPAGTAAFALVLDDPDAPSGTFTHWLLADLPAGLTTLDEGARLPGVVVAGTNDFSRVGYGGPCPPRGHGPHRYRFHLHALDAPLGLPDGFTRKAIDRALGGHVLATAALRPSSPRPRGRKLAPTIHPRPSGAIRCTVSAPNKVDQRS